jgi:hypothetical protein
MATTLTKITEFLDHEGLDYLHKEGKQHVRLRLPTRKYAQPGGKAHQLELVIALEEEGCYVKVIAPQVYHFPASAGSFQKLALMQSLLQISLMSKMVQFEYDADDGEVRAIVEFPLEDAQLTSRQLMRCVHGLVKVMDRHHATIQDAIKHGLVPESPAALQKAYEKYLEERRAKRKRDLWGDGSEGA